MKPEAGIVAGVTWRRLVVENTVYRWRHFSEPVRSDASQGGFLFSAELLGCPASPLQVRFPNGTALQVGIPDPRFPLGTNTVADLRDGEGAAAVLILAAHDRGWSPAQTDATFLVEDGLSLLTPNHSHEAGQFEMSFFFPVGQDWCDVPGVVRSDSHEDGDPLWLPARLASGHAARLVRDWLAQQQPTHLCVQGGFVPVSNGHVLSEEFPVDEVRMTEEWLISVASLLAGSVEARVHLEEGEFRLRRRQDGFVQVGGAGSSSCPGATVFMVSLDRLAQALLDGVALFEPASAAVVAAMDDLVAGEAWVSPAGVLGGEWRRVRAEFSDSGPLKIQRDRLQRRLEVWRQHH